MKRGYQALIAASVLLLASGCSALMGSKSSHEIQHPVLKARLSRDADVRLANSGRDPYKMARAFSLYRKVGDVAGMVRTISLMPVDSNPYETSMDELDKYLTAHPEHVEHPALASLLEEKAGKVAAK